MGHTLAHNTWGSNAAPGASRSQQPLTLSLLVACRLKDVEHADGKLYLVFEWLDKDLKKYMDSVGAMSLHLIKVCDRRPVDAHCRVLNPYHATTTAHAMRYHTTHCSHTCISC